MLPGMFALVQAQILQLAELTMPPANTDGIRKILTRLRVKVLFSKK